MILALETSCDDTCASVVTHAGEVRSNVIASQGLLHACGQTSWKSSKLKLSASKALVLLSKLCDPHQNDDARTYQNVVKSAPMQITKGLPQPSAPQHCMRDRLLTRACDVWWCDRCGADGGRW